MRITLALVLALVPLASTACGTDTRSDLDDPEAGDGYVPLIANDWTLSPSTEKFLCVRQTVTEDLWIKAIRPVASAGSHHAVLMVGPPDAPDGTVECNASLAKPAIYASGLGSNQLAMPDGVAVHVRPGDQLLLNLHLFNAGDAALSGTTAIEILTTTPVDAAHEAGVALAGKAAGLVVDPGMSSQEGTCTTPAGLTMFALAPHMHTRGIHMTVTYGSDIMFDDDYTFDEQRFHELAPSVASVAGQQLTIKCDYFNETAAPIYFGESTTDEMCFALFYVYPMPSATKCTK